MESRTVHLARVLRAAVCVAATCVSFGMVTVAQAGWQFQDSQLYNTINAVSFPTPNAGWVVGADRNIFRTADGGSTWTTQTTDIGQYSSLYSVSFVDASTGWAVGGSAAILHTHDGGAHWTRQNAAPETALLSSVCFSDANNGLIVVGGAGNRILRTGDGGETWTAVELPAPASGMWTGYTSSAGSGWVLGTKGQLYRTQTGGTTWQLVSTGTTSDLTGVCFSGSNGWICGGSGLMLRSSNGGTTWTRQVTGVKAGLRAVRFIDATHGWAVGDAGTIITTNDGGVHWTKHYTGTTWGFNAIAAPDAAHAVAVGSYGLIYVQTPRLKTKMYHWPLAPRVTYKRKGGVAKFTLWSRVTIGKHYAPAVPVSLQESANRKKWKTIGKYTSNADAWASKTFKVKAKRTRYYRWTVTGTVDYAKCTTAKQKVTVK